MDALARAEAEMQARATRVWEAAVASGATLYDRERDLPRLIAWRPGDPTKGIVPSLRRALAAEKRRLVDAHWCRDLNRVMAFAQALAAEEALLCAS